MNIQNLNPFSIAFGITAILFPAGFLIYWFILSIIYNQYSINPSVLCQEALHYIAYEHLNKPTPFSIEKNIAAFHLPRDQFAYSF
ncbi:hypothetical protein [Marivirga arenosa]|uniref:hypothetical protein n=1 Tax=Marivirga arenosa TaxID=3059076 RepID=UPI002AC9CFC1|nr:hypothetical protein [Marivirga sp. BKB1-2]